MQQSKCIAIIPARGGSKGLPGKNLLPLAGKPLLAWTIEAALQSSSIDRVIVSSDDEKILKVAEEFGAEALRRPEQFATDESASDVVIQHVLDSFPSGIQAEDLIVFLQPTSPLRDAADIDQAVSQFSASNAKALISVTAPAHHPLKSFTLDEQGNLQALVDPKHPFMRRQDLPECYIPNGAIYLMPKAVFEQHGFFVSGETLAFVMPAEKSIDIDSSEDLEQATRLLG